MESKRKIKQASKQGGSSSLLENFKALFVTVLEKQLRRLVSNIGDFLRESKWKHVHCT